MKILHCADIHLGDLSGPVVSGKNARRQDTIDCMISLTKDAMCRHPHVSIIAGDLFNRSRVWADTALEDITDAVTYLLRPLSECSEHVVLLFGTLNHDNPRAFEVLSEITKDLSNLHIYTTPDVHTLSTTDGDIQILALPGFDKGRLRTFMPDADKETENQNATALVNDVLFGLATKLDNTKPSILVAHYTVAGSEIDNGQTFLAGQDVVLLPQTIDATGVSLACLGHIHKHQCIGILDVPTFYSGSINQLTFGDEGSCCGYYVHNLTKYGDFDNNDFVVTPFRRHYTLELSGEDISEYLLSGSISDVEVVKDAIAGVRYTCTSEQEKVLNKSDLQKLLMASGAFHVAEIVRNDNETVTDYEQLCGDTPSTALQRYLSNNSEINNEEVERLMELAAPLISKADDGTGENHHSGTFIPVRIELQNYRSYTSASFCFDDIRMAMVNGPNGVGKSSLFMDSIADALFEASRDGQVGGWLRDGEKAGSVSFEFAMGDTCYRVVRTRTKSGKGTLAFSLRMDGGWVDCGGSTMKLTQANIERVLGMDCQTFCSIALIRQDAYGLFLEADSDRRMEVLASLLNLDIYVRLEEMAKTCASEQRRSIADIKGRMSVLSEMIGHRGKFEAELRERENQAALISERIKELDDQIAVARREETLREELKHLANEKEKDLRCLETQYEEKTAKLEVLQSDLADARKNANLRDVAEKATVAVNDARDKLADLAPFENEFGIRKQRQNDLASSIDKARRSLDQIRTERYKFTNVISHKDEIESAVRETAKVARLREAIMPRVKEYEEARRAELELMNNVKSYFAEASRLEKEITYQIEVSEKKASLLADSGCPNPDTATCSFLADAKKAESGLARLIDNLEQMKSEHADKYTLLMSDYSSSKDVFNTMKDPQHDIDLCDRLERQAKEYIDQAPELERAMATIGELEKQEAMAQKNILELSSELSAISADFPSLEAKVKLANDLRNVITDNEQKALVLPECMAAEATVNALTAQIEMVNSDIGVIEESVNATLNSLDAIYDKIHYTEHGLTSLRDCEIARQLQVDLSYENSQKIGSLKSHISKLTEDQKQYDEYAKEVKAIARHLNDYQTLSQAFGIDGIQRMIICGIVPEIMHRTNDILGAMTGGKMAVDFRTEREQKNAKIINCLDVWVKNLNGSCRPYSSHSGGEKVKVALAVTLALADVKARRAGVQLGMLFIDEPPFLDSDGTEAYADALATMAARNPEMRILAISHDPTMKARFQQNITVSTGENGSVVEGGC